MSTGDEASRAPGDLDDVVEPRVLHVHRVSWVTVVTLMVVCTCRGFIEVFPHGRHSRREPGRARAWLSRHHHH